MTITGTGFLAGATVSLGGTAATGVTVVSSTSITATTAAHAAGAVNVVVTNTDAQTGTLTNGYTYTTSTGRRDDRVRAGERGHAADGQCAVLLSYGVAQTAGNLNVVAVGWNDTMSTVSSVSDSAGEHVRPGGDDGDGDGGTAGDLLREEHCGGEQHGDGGVQPGGAVCGRCGFWNTAGWTRASPLDVTAGAAGSGDSANSGRRRRPRRTS